MSFKATLEISGRNYNILELDYSLFKETGLNGMPSSVVRGGKINMVLESNDNAFFFEWMCNSFEKKDGSILLKKRDEDPIMKEIRFKNAYLVSYGEKLKSSSTDPLTESITLSAMEISIGNGTLLNEWHS